MRLELELPARPRSDKMMAGPGHGNKSSPHGQFSFPFREGGRTFVWDKDRPRPGCAVSTYCR